MRTDVQSSIDRWLTRPLCRRYVGAVFCSTPTSSVANGRRESAVIFWGLGRLATGEVDVVGAWLSREMGTPAPASMFGDLRSRGAEFIRLGVGNLEGVDNAFKQIYRHSEFVPSMEQELEAVLALVALRHRATVAGQLRAVAEAKEADARRAGLEKFQASCLGERYPEVAERWARALAGFEPIYKLSAQLRGLVRSADRTAAEVRGRLTRAILRHGPFVDSTAALEFVATTLDRAEQRLDRERAVAVAAREAGSTTLRRHPPIAGAVSVPALA
ncbi:transposase [Roseateles sp.]|uniref:transposase n=1 Tax=Roseateles sp. TaxID=1971397 RepID=UPI0039E960FA